MVRPRSGRTVACQEAEPRAGPPAATGPNRVEPDVGVAHAARRPRSRETTVALLLTRPGRGPVSPADRVWSKTLTDIAERFAVPLEPIFRANTNRLNWSTSLRWRSTRNQQESESRTVSEIDYGARARLDYIEQQLEALFPGRYVPFRRPVAHGVPLQVVELVRAGKTIAAIRSTAAPPAPGWRRRTCLESVRWEPGRIGYSR